MGMGERKGKTEEGGNRIGGIPGIQHNARTLRDSIAHILIIAGNCMRDTQRRGRHPAEGFLDTSANIRQIWFVVHGRQTVGADDAVDFLLGALLHIGEDEHGLDEAHKDVGRCFGAGFQEEAADVGGEAVGDVGGFLGFDEVDAEAVLEGEGGLEGWSAGGEGG